MITNKILSLDDWSQSDFISENMPDSNILKYIWSTKKMRQFLDKNEDIFFNISALIIAGFSL